MWFQPVFIPSHSSLFIPYRALFTICNLFVLPMYYLSVPLECKLHEGGHPSGSLGSLVSSLQASVLTALIMATVPLLEDFILDISD